MSYPQRHTVSITTNASGAGTGYTADVLRGRVSMIRYTKDDYATGVDLAITAEDSGQDLWSENDVNATKEVYPVTEADLPDGSQSSLTEVPIYVCGERVKIAVTNGGNAKSGTFEVVVV